jgi:hypothetical protein
MKFKLLLLLGFSFHMSMAQDLWFDEEDEYTPFLKTGDFVVSLNVGYPNWGKYYVNNHVQSNSLSNVQTNGVAPIFASGTYFYNNRVSFTLTAMYNNWGGSWRDNFVGDYKFNIHRLRFLFGAEYHLFEFNINKVDWYIGGAIGGNTIMVDYSSDDPNWSPRQNGYFTQNNDDLDFPLTARVYAGMRYFFNENWGANMELSYGAATLSWGINYKF